MVNVMFASGRVDAFPEDVNDVLHMVVTDDCVVPAKLLTQKLSVKIRTVAKLSVIPLSVLITRIADEVNDHEIMVYTNDAEIAKIFKRQNIVIDDVAYVMDSKVLSKTVKTTKKKTADASKVKKTKEEAAAPVAEPQTQKKETELSAVEETLEGKMNAPEESNEDLSDYTKLGLDAVVAKAAKDAVHSSTEKEIGFPTKLRMNLALAEKMDVYEETLELLKPHYDKLKKSI